MSGTTELGFVRRGVSDPDALLAFGIPHKGRINHVADVCGRGLTSGARP